MRSADDSVRVLPEGDLPGGARADGTDLSGGECADPPMRDGEPGRAEQPNDASAEVLPNAPCQLQDESAAVFPSCAVGVGLMTKWRRKPPCSECDSYFHEPGGCDEYWKAFPERFAELWNRYESR